MNTSVRISAIPSAAPLEGPQLTLSQNEQNEAAAFDRIADRLDKSYLRTSDWTFSRYRQAMLGMPMFHMYPDLVFAHLGKCFPRSQDLAKPLAGLKVLDLGAGDGVWSVILAEQGAEVISIEISPKQVERARERMRNHGLSWDARVGSAFRLEDQFAPGSFDLVFSQAILHHLVQDLPAVYRGVASLLRLGGYSTMTEPYCGSARLRRIRERMSWLVPIDCESPDERPLTDEDLAPLPGLFAQVEIDRFELFARIARRIWGRGSFEGSLYRFDRFLLQQKAFSRLAGGVFISVKK